MRFWTPKIAHLLFLSLLFAVPVSPTSEFHIQPIKQQSGASVEHSDGLATAVFNTKQGTIRVNMPNDMMAGDSISGTVYLAPTGKDDNERQANHEKLAAHTIAIGQHVSPAAVRVLNFEIPDGGEGVTVDLRDKNGKSVKSLSVPTAEAFVELSEGEYQVPSAGQTGRWINILGSFDSDLTNTGLSIGGVPANPLAESPRKTVFQSPANVTGLTKLAFQEGNTEVIKDFRNIDVKLTATKLRLQRGETTNVTLNVTGLAGIEDDLPLHLTCSGSADMQGGNVQNLQISPSQVNEGSFIQSRTLIGNQVGNFNVTATVLFDAGVRVVNKDLVHVERNPGNIGGDGNPPIWWIKVKTLDGQMRDIYIKRNQKPDLQVCNWIQITDSRTDEIGDVYVETYIKADDPNAPCVLENKTIHIEGDPQDMGNGRWFITVTFPDGKRGFIQLKAPKKPDLKLCNWIKVSGCKRLQQNTFQVDGYTMTKDPNTPDPTPTPTPTPAPTPTPVKVPAPVVTPTPCVEGTIRFSEETNKTFKILSMGSQLEFNLTTNNDGNDIAAAGMARWLTGLADLTDILKGKLVPDDQALGGGVADAVLQYLKFGGQIATAIAKSNFKNLNTSSVTGTLSTKLIEVKATCTRYQICEGGRYVWKQKYSETRELVDYTDSITVTVADSAWDQVSVTSQPQKLDPDKAEKYLLTKLIEKLKGNEVAYGTFKKKCK